MATLVSGSPSDFPSFDAFHSNCAMTVTYPNTDCTAQFKTLENTINSFAPGPSGGMYAIKEETTNEYIWATRTTPTHHYVDDIIFQFNDDDNACTIQAKSRS